MFLPVCKTGCSVLMWSECSISFFSVESAGEDEEEAASGDVGGCMKPSALRGGSGGADVYLDMPRIDPPSSTTCLLIEKPDVVDKKVKVSTNIHYDK